jgi:Nitrate reductase gamma subunit
VSLESPVAGSGTFPTFVSVSLIDLSATIILLVIVVILAAKYAKVSPSTSRLLGRGKKEIGISGLFATFASELVNRVLLQKDIINERLRRLAHLCMFWGFVGLAATTTADYLLNRQGNYIRLFGGDLSWIRILGNVSGVVMMFGASITIARMIGVRRFRERITFSDAWFSVLLFLVGLTGFVAEYFGEIAHTENPNAPPAAAFTISMNASPLIVIPYGAHLVLIALLFISAPLSAFIHAFRVPSLRYLDRVGNVLAQKKSKKEENTGNEIGAPFIQNTLSAIKEEVMIDQIKSLYEKSENQNLTEEKDRN